MFGGSDDNGLFGDTWTWNGSSWSQTFPLTSPPARSDAGITYGGSATGVLLFGGHGGTKDFNDTWVWNGSNWSQQSPTVSPSIRGGPRLVFDQIRGNILLFGGFCGCSLYAGDTWVWKVETAAAVPTKLAFTQQPPSSATVSQQFTTKVTAEDASGNLVTTDGSTSITLSATGGSGHLTCAANPQTDLAGVATFNCAIDALGSYVLHATAGTLTPADSATFSVGPPTQFGLATVSPASITLNSSVPINLNGWGWQAATVFN
ncbi:MAG: hypothetical protein ACYDCQ_22535 [Dehalococcoidia bacterium]